jgi:putative flippase GtrA
VGASDIAGATGMSGGKIHLPERILRYGVAGFLVTAIYSGLVIGLLHGLPQLGPTGSSALAFILLQPVGLLLHSLITYPETMQAPSYLGKIGLRFVFTNALGFIISVSGMALLTMRFHESYLWGVLFACVVVPAINFLIYLFWAFKPARNQHRPELP